ncbi:hypothetical protein IQ230_09685 [Gloeocapsopsis crepidinum LEGE 06123]|uniref:Uncharacterized protein n=1 Tax=Gloeocapsopsis crepidinum LEGE 06123 TaxID=588587 RepID=A0ABR9UQR1_9CHRO|nr:hypothetical protein [Gloeocapsopsis crepidinum]MBE9190627.1 hypothetical protein [Gloeocapsopsis crepidinum LEGE 06123]
MKVIAHGFRKREINGEIVYEALPAPSREELEQIQAEVEAQTGRKVSSSGGCYLMASGGVLSCHNESCVGYCYHQRGNDERCICTI